MHGIYLATLLHPARSGRADGDQSIPELMGPQGVHGKRMGWLEAIVNLGDPITLQDSTMAVLSQMPVIGTILTAVSLNEAGGSRPADS